MIIVFPRSQINRKYEGSGQTPLHLAASCGDQAMIALLLRMGAALGQYIVLQPIIITVAGVCTKEKEKHVSFDSTWSLCV